MDEDQFNQLIERLKTIAELLAINLLPDGPPAETTSLLKSAALANSQIADLFDTSSSCIRTALSRAQRKQA
ncbi:MAG: hypothetical protein ACE5HJ_01440 [Thermoplasmata archaeon]